MIDIAGLPDHPIRYMLIAIAAGFGFVAVAKIYGLFFMRWKTPFRLGSEMNVARAEVVEWADGQGYVSADGELWRATSKSALAPGDLVRIQSVNGLTLQVSKKQN